MDPVLAVVGAATALVNQFIDVCSRLEQAQRSRKLCGELQRFLYLVQTSLLAIEWKQLAPSVAKSATPVLGEQ